jgi:aspartate carbamoyltransferase catalytic subunit
MPLPFKHLISTKQLTRADTEAILKVASDMEKVRDSGKSDLLRGKILASLFYEPSTRTRLSFETAMLRLGGDVITAEGIQFSSLYKGEKLEDTMEMVSQYADIVAMRHPEQGSADRAITTCKLPFINAGDGPGQHPTQALLDLYTIKKECKRIDGISVGFVGDLRYGRTVHSLSYLLGLYKNVWFTLVSPKSRALQTAELFAKTKIYQDDRLVEIDKTQDPTIGLPRILSFLLEISQQHPQKTIAIFSHGRLIRTLLAHLGHTTIESSPSGSLKNCGYVILDVTNKIISITKVIGLQHSP